MSGPYRQILGPALSKLREKLELARQITEADERNEEGIKELRRLRVFIRQKVEQIEKTVENWRKYMITLDGDDKVDEERLFEGFHHREIHVGEWIGEAYDVLTAIDIVMAEDDQKDEESDKASDISVLRRNNY